MSAVTPEQALAEFRAAGYEPVGSYPGRVMVPWPSQCARCGAPRKPSLNNVRNGVRCQHRWGALAARPAAPDGVLVAEMKLAGYEPVGPYPGRVDIPWQARCLVCGSDRLPTVAKVRAGERCHHLSVPATRVEAVTQELREFGYEPVGPCPGHAQKPWDVRCLRCGGTTRVRMYHLRRSGKFPNHGCRCQGRVQTLYEKKALALALAVMQAAGYEPLEPYPGARWVRWKSRCTVCGATRFPQVAAVERGQRCQHRTK